MEEDKSELVGSVVIDNQPDFRGQVTDHPQKMNETSRCSNRTRQTSIIDMNLENIIALIVRLLFVLKKKFPFPNDLNPAAVNVEMFDRPNMQLMSSIVHYLLNVINPENCTRLVPHPLSVKSIAHFHRGAMKFLTQTFNELPHIKVEGVRASTLAASSGDRFIDFLARLVTNTVQLVYEKYGIVSIPSPVGVDVNDKLNIMQTKEDRATLELFQQRHPSVKKISDVPRYDEALQKLKATGDRLKSEYNEVVTSCPSPYRGSLESSSPQQVVAVLKSWQNDLKKSLDELSHEHEASQVWSNAIGGDNELTDASKEPTRLEGAKLLNLKNEPVIFKVAEDQKIKLFEGPAVYLPGFLRCTSAIAAKLNTLIMNSKFREPVERDLALETSLERLSELNVEMNGDIVKTENDIKYLKDRCQELQRMYDELVAKGEITYRYFYSRSFPNPRLKIPSLHESTALALSPGNSWKEEVEDVKRKCRRNEGDSPDTPKLSRIKRMDNSSMSNLSRTVLKKREWASGSRGADSTVGEMGPLSSSSPVNSAGDYPHVTTRKSLSNIIDDISLLDAELNEFLGDVSEMADTGEDSGHLSPDDTFGDSPSLKRFQGPSEQRTATQLFHASGQSKLPKPNPPPPSAIPARRLRPSLDALVTRYTTWREKMNY